jgi:hypothetical protein
MNFPQTGASSRLPQSGTIPGFVLVGENVAIPDPKALPDWLSNLNVLE